MDKNNEFLAVSLTSAYVELFDKLAGAFFHSREIFLLSIVGRDHYPGVGVRGPSMGDHKAGFHQLLDPLPSKVDEDVHLLATTIAVFEPLNLKETKSA